MWRSSASRGRPRSPQPGGQRVRGMVANDQRAGVERASDLLAWRKVPVCLRLVAARPGVHAAPLSDRCGENKDGAAGDQAASPARNEEPESNDADLTRGEAAGRLSARHSPRWSPARWRWAYRRSSSASPTSGLSPAPSGGSRWPCRRSTPGCGSASAARRPTRRIGRADLLAGLAFAGDLFFWHLSIVTHQRRQRHLLRHHRADLGGRVRLAAFWRARRAAHAGRPRALPRRRRRAAGAEPPPAARRRDRRPLRHRHRRVLRTLFPRREGGAARRIRRRGSPSWRPSSPPRCC